ncbi:E3 ubiquitin-protein ligase parkin-like [Lytechinus variegatus]|uniref:E3 ubiquitin-protein ligase parkin-like n=1 Tax=Lytechinus variegatus TaxID=7654 RepID=UPI001BB27C0E|nr:E3 ubiquitin-protein ligase parkin-like [Lytechinus variegatus]
MIACIAKRRYNLFCHFYVIYKSRFQRVIQSKMDQFLISVKLIQSPRPRLGKFSENVGLAEMRMPVHATQSGAEIRDEVARLSGQSPADIRLIFAGKLITDVQTMEDLRICENTVIHAVPSQRIQHCETIHDTDVEQPPVLGLLESRIVDKDGNIPDLDPGSSLRPGFYVYCKSHCVSIQPGKLRVCCQTCKDPAFIVREDPVCWDDVILSDRISGSCLTPGCQGDKAEFFFKCSSHIASGNDQLTVLPLIRTNTRRVMCITCADVLISVLVFPCSAAHVMCLDCFSQYCRLCLNERRFIQSPQLGYTLPCPAGCEDSLIKDTHHFLVLGKEQYARYKRFGTEEYLLSEGGVFCPSPGCGAGILLESGEERRVECLQEEGFGCGFVFCRNCHEAYHDGACGQKTEEPQSQTALGSEVNSERERQARWENEESRRIIAETSKPCPNCKVPVERNGGCMHMVCSQAQCKYEWCWICGIGWNMDCLEDHWFGTGFLL